MKTYNKNISKKINHKIFISINNENLANINEN